MKKDELTSGPVGRQLFVFALPLIGISLIQQLYNMVDLLFVGNLLGTEATAAVGASGLLVTCIVGFFTGLSTGTGVIVSMAVGVHDDNRVEKTIHTALAVSLIGGVSMSIIGILASKQLLIWMNTPDAVLDQACVYIRIYLLSMLPLFIYNMNSGIIRAGGNSRMPLMFQIAGSVTNIIFDAVTMAVLGMGVEGAAIATVVSQLAAAIASVIYLRRQEGAWRLCWNKVRIDTDVLRMIFRLGVPAGLQSLVITLSNIFVQYAINGLGVDEVAAYALYGKVELIIYLPLVAFGQSMTTFAGQNMGAGEKARVKKGMNTCTLMGMVYAAVTAVLLLMFGQYVFGLFTGDSAVIALGMRMISVTFPFYWVYAILETTADTLRGCGRSIEPMVIIMLNICLLRTIILQIFVGIWGTLESVAAVYPTVWITAALCLRICWSIYWKKETAGRVRTPA